MTMTVPTTMSTTGASSIDGAGGEHLTPEALLAYCTSRMNDLDAQIKTRFTEQQNKTNEAHILNDVLAVYNGYANGQAAHAKYKDENDKEVDVLPGVINAGKRLCELYNQSSNATVRIEILKAYELMTGQKMPMDNGSANAAAVAPDREKIIGLDAAAWAKKTDSVKNVQDDFSKSNELSMIQLQSIISQRQLAIQLTTQLMSSLNDGLKKITENVR